MHEGSKVRVIGKICLVFMLVVWLLRPSTATVNSYCALVGITSGPAAKLSTVMQYGGAGWAGRGSGRFAQSFRSLEKEETGGAPGGAETNFNLGGMASKSADFQGGRGLGRWSEKRRRNCRFFDLSAGS